MNHLSPSKLNDKISSLGVIVDTQRRISSRMILSQSNFFWYEEAKKWMLSNRYVKAAKLFIANAKDSIDTLCPSGSEEPLRIKIIRGYIFCASSFFYRKHLEKNKKFKHGIDYVKLFKQIFDYILEYKEILFEELEEAKKSTLSSLFEKTARAKVRSIELIDPRKRKKSFISLIKSSRIWKFTSVHS